MRGYSAFESELIQLPGALGPVVMLRTGEQLYQRLGARRILIVGSAGLAVTSGMFLLVDLQTSVLWISGIMLLRGIALALAFVCVQATAFATIGPERIGRASSLFSTQRQVAASVGVAAAAASYPYPCPAQGLQRLAAAAITSSRAPASRSFEHLRSADVQVGGDAHRAAVGRLMLRST